MTPRFLITDNGTHSPEKWAMATAQTIFDIDQSVAGDRLIKAQRLQLTIAEALVPHHSKVQEDEHAKLAGDDSHIITPYAVEEYLKQALADIVAAAKATLWENHFLNQNVQASITDVLSNHFMTSQHVERLWHADRNPQHQPSQQYKSRFQG